MIPFALPGCVVTGTSSYDQTLVIDAQATTTDRVCPTCQYRATRVHSRYLRTPRDLPISSQRVQLRLVVRRFFCDDPNCPRKTFAEALPDLLPRKAQRTTRLTATLYDLGAEAGGTSGAYLAERLRIRTSPDTIVRVLRRQAQPIAPTPHVLGVDEFALQKGRIYGTILVAIERSAPIDLLPDRKPETLARWLQEHTGVAVITRDRSTEFTRGATDGAPNAVQVADRWHLLTNLREAMERMLQRRLPELAQLPLPDTDGVLPSPVQPLFPQRTSVRARVARQARREERAQRFQAVQELTKQGMNILQIADYLNLSRQTVRRYRSATDVPEPPPPRPSHAQIVPYLNYREQQWAAGARNAARLTRAIQAQGYQGRYRQVARWAQQLRVREGTSQATTVQLRPNVQQQLAETPSKKRRSGTFSGSARQIVWLLVRDRKKLNDPEEAELVRLLQDTEVAQRYGLAQQFQQMVRQRQMEHLDSWLEQCRFAGASELQRFAAGLRQEDTSIRAALSLSYRNGPVEGQITRLKLLKRQMYGRAKLDLLKLRVVHRR